MPRPSFTAASRRVAWMIFLLGLTGCATTTTAPPSSEIVRLDGSTVAADTLTQRIEALTRAAGVHGLTVTVFNDAEAVYSRAFGFADEPAGRPLATKTELYGASLSKARPPAEQQRQRREPLPPPADRDDRGPLHAPRVGGVRAVRSGSLTPSD